MKASSRLAAPRAFDQLLGRVARQHFSRVHEGDPVAAHPFVHEVRRHEDRDALLARKIDQELPEAVAGDRIDARRRLVQNQDLRLVQNGDGQGKPLAQAHRQILGQRIEMRAEAESLDQLLDARLRLLRREVIEARVQGQVLAHAQLAVERERLRHVAEVLANLHASGFDGAAEERRGPFGGRQEPGQHLHGRGLAAAVGAEEAEDLAALDRQRDVVDGGEAAEAARQAVGFDGDLRLARRRGAGW